MTQQTQALIEKIRTGTASDSYKNSNDKKTRILIVDDHPLCRRGVILLLKDFENLQVCGEAETTGEALDAIERLSPDLVIVDLSLKDSNGIDFIKLARTRFSNIRMLVFSMHDDVVVVERTLKAGARGYVSKREDAVNLLRAIEQVAAGHHYLSEQMKKNLVERQFLSGSENAPPTAHLSDRELEVFQLLGSGHPIPKIAENLHLSVKTIEGYCSHIRSKLGLKNNLELILAAIRNFERRTS